MNVLSTQEAFLDRLPLANHQRLIDSIRSQNVHNGHGLVGGDQLDAMCYDGIDIDMLESMIDTPLHFKVQGKDIGIELCVNISKVKGNDERSGKSSICTETSRKYNMFTNPLKWEMTPDHGPGIQGDTTHYNVKTNRSKSIRSVVQSMVKNGDMRIVNDSTVNILVDKIAKNQSCQQLCQNLYLLLQKSISLYSHDKTGLMGTEYEVEIFTMSSHSLIESVKRQYAIDIDAFSDQELGVLMAGLLGNDKTTVTRGGLNTIFDILKGVPISFYLISSTEEPELRSRSRLRGTTGLIPPEVMNKVIISIISKLGCLDDWVSTIRKMRGMSRLLQTMDELLDGKEGVVRRVSMGCPADNCTSTIFSNACEGFDRCSIQNTNMMSASTNLILENAEGQLMFNNFHYMAESVGAENLGAYDACQYALDITLFEMGMNDRNDVSSLNLMIFNLHDGETPMVEIDAIRSVFSAYILGMQDWYKMRITRSAALIGSLAWLQLNITTGCVLSSNMTQVYDKCANISAATTGTRTSSRALTEFTHSWMFMHGMSDELIWFFGIGSMASGDGYRAFKKVRKETKFLRGEYDATNYGIGISETNYVHRSGAESASGANLQRLMSYISTNIIDNGKIMGDIDLVCDIDTSGDCEDAGAASSVVTDDDNSGDGAKESEEIKYKKSEGRKGMHMREANDDLNTREGLMASSTKPTRRQMEASTRRTSHKTSKGRLGSTNASDIADTGDVGDDGSLYDILKDDLDDRDMLKDDELDDIARHDMQEEDMTEDKNDKKLEETGASTNEEITWGNYAYGSIQRSTRRIEGARLEELMIPTTYVRKSRHTGMGMIDVIALSDDISVKRVKEKLGISNSKHEFDEHYLHVYAAIKGCRAFLLRKENSTKVVKAYNTSVRGGITDILVEVDIDGNYYPINHSSMEGVPPDKRVRKYGKFNVTQVGLTGARLPLTMIKEIKNQLRASGSQDDIAVIRSTVRDDTGVVQIVNRKDTG